MARIYEGHIIGFSEKFFWGQMGHNGLTVGPIMMDLCNFQSALKIFKIFSTVKSGQQVHEGYIVDFSKEVLI